MRAHCGGAMPGALKNVQLFGYKTSYSAWVGVMDETSRQTSVFATGARVWHWLGILIGTATLISLVKNGFAIELSGLPAQLYKTYAWLRDMLFLPVVWTLRYFDLTMPVWLKDAVMAYGLASAAYARTIEGRSGIHKRTTWNRFLDVAGGVFWPEVVIRPFIGSTDPRSPIFWRGFLRSFLLNLATVSLLAIAFFLWNHFQNAFGPGG
jgi:hypothetical protein